MAKDLTPDEILEQQRQEATKVYADKVKDLNEQISVLLFKHNDLESTLNLAFQDKKKELDTLESELKAKIAEADDRDARAKALLRDAQIKSDEAENLYTHAQMKMSDHANTVDKHIASAQERSDDLAARNFVCSQREIDAELKNKEADERIAYAVKKEQDANAAVDNLNIIIGKSQTKIEEQEAIRKSNEAQSAQLETLRMELDGRKNSEIAEKQDFTRQRDDLDKARLKLNQDMSSVESKLELLKEKQVQYELNMQKYQDSIKDLQNREGKLNELKNNVETLMKNKEGA